MQENNHDRVANDRAVVTHLITHRLTRSLRMEHLRMENESPSTAENLMSSHQISTNDGADTKETMEWTHLDYRGTTYLEIGGGHHEGSSG